MPLNIYITVEGGILQTFNNAIFVEKTDKIISLKLFSRNPIYN